MRAYLAGPVRGRPNLNKEAFLEAGARIEAEGYELFNPGKDVDNALPCKEIMAECLFQVAMSDVVFVLPDWQGSSGAQLEVKTAHALGIPVKFLDPDGVCRVATITQPGWVC